MKILLTGASLLRMLSMVLALILLLSGHRVFTHGPFSRVHSRVPVEGTMIIYYSNLLNSWVRAKKILGIRIPVSRNV